MIIKDMMPNFELYQPTQLKDAYGLLDKFGKDAWKMAGGMDSLVWFKERSKRPKAVIDLGGIAEMKGIKETADGIEIGALTTLTDVSTNPVVMAKFRLLAEAAGKVANAAHAAFGAMGFTREHQLHYATRRLWAWRDDFGSEVVWQTELGRYVAAKGGRGLWAAIAEHG